MFEIPNYVSSFSMKLLSLVKFIHDKPMLFQLWFFQAGLSVSNNSLPRFHSVRYETGQQSHSVRYEVDHLKPLTLLSNMHILSFNDKEASGERVK